MSKFALMWFGFGIAALCGVLCVRDVYIHDYPWATVMALCMLINYTNATRILIVEEIKQAIREKR